MKAQQVVSPYYEKTISHFAVISSSLQILVILNILSNILILNHSYVVRKHPLHMRTWHVNI